MMVYAQGIGEVVDGGDRGPEHSDITDATLRGDKRLQHLLALPKETRNQLLRVSADGRRELYLLRQAEEKRLELARKNRRLSVQHFKGQRRKTHRPGMGKSSSCAAWSLGHDDFDAALEYAYVSVHKSTWHNRSVSQPIDVQAVLDQFIQSSETTRWDEAVQRAELATHCCSRGPSPTELQLLVSALEESGGNFDMLRAKFLRRYGKALFDSLNQCSEGRSITPAPLALEVQERFLAACGQRVAKICPGFHGTTASVHDSIFQRGLLIPGQENNLRVANGSAHGNGVYIAKLNNPWLSQGFTRGANKMLVCGVVDDATDLTQAQRFGSFDVTKESDNVRHVGDAMVVFQSVRVAPLFVAEWRVACPRRVGAAPKKRRPTGYIRCYSRYDGYALRNKWDWEANKHRRGQWLEKQNFPWNWPQFLWSR